MIRTTYTCMYFQQTINGKDVSGGIVEQFIFLKDNKHVLFSFSTDILQLIACCKRIIYSKCVYWIIFFYLPARILFSTCLLRTSL